MKQTEESLLRQDVILVDSFAEAMKNLTLCRDRERLQQTLLDGLVQGLNFQRAAIWSLNDRRSHFTLAGHRGFQIPLPQSIPIHGPGQDPVFTWICKNSRQVTYPVDSLPMTRLYANVEIKPNSYALIPMRQPIPMQQRRLRDRDLSDKVYPLSGILLLEPMNQIGNLFLDTFLSTANLIAEKVFRNQYLEDLSRRDGLTGLLNRQEMMNRLARNAWVARNSHELGILFLDIDHFKKVNDTHGHDVGDLVLEAIARNIDRTIRSEDVVGRIGGEELLVLLPVSEKGKLRAVAERIRESVAGLRFPSSAPGLRVTLSAGGALFPTHARTCRNLMRRADEALYMAKRSGRNRVVIFGD